MVKVSASREMTTPWNFILDPLGTDRRLTFWLLGVWLVETWAEAAIARTSRPHTRVNGRNLLITLLLISSPSVFDRNASRHSGFFSVGFGERISPMPGHRETKLTILTESLLSCVANKRSLRSQIADSGR